MAKKTTDPLKALRAQLAKNQEVIKTAEKSLAARTMPSRTEVLAPFEQAVTQARAVQTTARAELGQQQLIRSAVSTIAAQQAALAAGAADANAEAQAAANAAAQAAANAAAAKRKASESAFEIFRGFLRQYGIEGLAADIEKYKLEGLSDDELLLRLRTESAAYKRRFKANESRIARGLRALSEAEYIGLEDQYQNIMRNYGLPPAYYARGEMGRQEGFEKFIGGDVSAAELEDRIQTAQNRVINAAPQVADTLRQFYPDITNGDILAYALDPDQALTNIRRKVTAAEIGAGAAMAGLTTGVARAEELGRYGVTGEQARTGFQTVAQVAPRGGQLAEIYKQTPYTQATAEQEVFGLAGAVEAQRQRRKLTELETAAFSGTSGAAAGALARDRAGSI